MNILLWVLQIFLALHTLTGAFWKFTHPADETMPSLAVIPMWAWTLLALFEILCAVGLTLPLLNKRFGPLPPIAAAFIALEMLLFCMLHIVAKTGDFGPLTYWLIVTGICAVVAYGRSVLKPH